MTSTSTMNRDTHQQPPVPCDHCRLPVPSGLVDASADRQFCCSGCSAAWKLIHASGLDAFYAMTSDQDPAAGSLKHIDALKPKGRFDEFDDPEFLTRFAHTVGKNHYEIRLHLDGIHCAACVWLIEKLPQILPGTESVSVNWVRQETRIRWNDDQTKLSKIVLTLFRLGYRSRPVLENQRANGRQLANRRQLVWIGVAAAAAGNNMIIAGALYLGMFSYMSPGMTQLMRVASCVVGMVSLLGPGRVFLQSAAGAIKTRTPHMDLPIAAGLIGGSTAGIVNTIRGTGEIWFDSLSVLVFLLLCGRWLQFRQQNRAADAVEMLYRMTPKKARKIVQGQPVDTFVELIQQGDQLEVRAGELIPVDARIVHGSAKIDESIMTGESCPQLRTVGDIVLAGTRNENSAIEIITTATGQQTRLGQIVGRVEQASLEQPLIVQWANQIGGYFVITVVVLAILNFAWWVQQSAAIAVDRSVALLIIACPCALALATPLAIAIALGRAAKQKIMVSRGDVLQSLNRPGMMWLDKTGTLTQGQLEVVQWYGQTCHQALIALIESRSSHAVAKALSNFGGGGQTLPPWTEIDDFIEHAAMGVSCNVDDVQLLIGNEKLLHRHQVEISPRQSQLAARLMQQGFTVCWIATGGSVSSIVALGDRIRPDTAPALNRLRDLGWEIGILSGDHQEVVNRVAHRLGIDRSLAIGHLSPEEKADRIKQTPTPTVVMVGDGVNDSAALATATVGIAVHGGAEASLAAAPVYLADEGLEPILRLLKISHSTNRTMRCNFAVSVLYNGAGAALATIGMINPLVAAIVMPLSSLSVVAISLTAGSGSINKEIR